MLSQKGASRRLSIRPRSSRSSRNGLARNLSRTDESGIVQVHPVLQKPDSALSCHPAHIVSEFFPIRPLCFVFQVYLVEQPDP